MSDSDYDSDDSCSLSSVSSSSGPSQRDYYFSVETHAIVRRRLGRFSDEYPGSNTHLKIIRTSHEHNHIVLAAPTLGTGPVTISGPVDCVETIEEDELFLVKPSDESIILSQKLSHGFMSNVVITFTLSDFPSQGRFNYKPSMADFLRQKGL